MNTANNSQTTNQSAGFRIDPGLFENTEHITNTDQQVISITIDRLHLVLLEHQNILKMKNDWITPLGIFLALLASLLAGEFNDYLSVTASVWEAAFLLGAIFCLYKLLRCLYIAWVLRDKGNIVNILEQIKTKPPR